MNGNRRRVTAVAVVTAAVLGVVTGALIALASSRTDDTIPVTADEARTPPPARSAPPATNEAPETATETPSTPPPRSGTATRGPATTAPAPTPATTPAPAPPTSTPAPRTDVPDSVLLTEQDLGLVRLAADNPESQGGIETLTKCLLGSDDLVDIASATFGATADGDARAYVGVISQESSAEAARQLEGFHEDMRSCEADMREWSSDPDLSIDVRPVDGGPGVAALGPGAWVYRVQIEDFTSVVVGFGQANTTGVLAFRAEELTAEEAVQRAGTVHERVTTVFGE